MLNKSRSLLFAVVILTLIFSGFSSAATLVVGPSETYTTVQSAVDAASEGDVINVKTGTYTEAITISTEGLTLKSIDGKGLAVLNGDGANDVITISVNISVIIDGFTIDGNGQDGIVHNGDEPEGITRIINNTITDCSTGVSASFGYYDHGEFTCSDNTVSNCSSEGIYIYGFGGTEIRIQRNTVTDCDTGLDIEETSEYVKSDCIVSDNVISTSTTGTYGLYLCCPEADDRCTNNTITGYFDYGIYYYANACCGTGDGAVFVEDNSVDGSDIGYYFYELSYSFDSSAYIMGNTATNCNTGMEFCETPYENDLNLFIYNNTVTDNADYGLYWGDDLSYGEEITLEVKGNTISGNGEGIYINAHSYPDDSTVIFEGNNIFNNTTYGFDNVSGEDIDINNNWWGDASGPSGDGPGTGDAISTTSTSIPTEFSSSLNPEAKEPKWVDPNAVYITKTEKGCSFGITQPIGYSIILAMLGLSFVFLRRRNRKEA